MEQSAPPPAAVAPSAPPQIAMPQPVIAPPPVVAAPATAPMATPPQMVQPTPPVQAIQAAPVIEPRPAREPAKARTIATVKAAPVVEAAPARAPEPATVPVTVQPAPLATPSLETSIPQPDTAAPATADQPAVNISASDQNAITAWALGGGIALVLLGVGGVMMLRRRKDSDEDRAPARNYYARTPTEPETAMTSPPRPAAALMDDASAPAGAVTSVEAMVARPPSPANPFLTRRNRTRRAHFLLRQPAAQPLPHIAPAQPAHTVATKEVVNPPVYDFGQGAKVRYRLTPATT